MPYLHLVLRVINLNLNINRDYEVLVDKGSFENWLVIITYGRFGEGDSEVLQFCYFSRSGTVLFALRDKILKKRFFNPHWDLDVIIKW